MSLEKMSISQLGINLGGQGMTELYTALAIAFVARSVADVFDVLDGVMRDLNGAKASAK